MRRCTSSPKPSERLFIKLVYIGAAGGAIAVLDAVKTGKVAGGLGTGKDVVGAESVFERWHGYGHDDSAEALKKGYAAVYGGRGVGIFEKVHSVGQYAYFKPAYIFADKGGKGVRGIKAGGIAGVFTAYYAEHKRIILHCACDGADLIKGGGEGDKPVAGYAAVGGLSFRTTPQKAAGCLMEPPVSLPRANGTSCAATAAALPPLLPPGTRSGLQGLSTDPKRLVCVEEPIANSSMFSLPSITQPA